MGRLYVCSQNHSEHAYSFQTSYFPLFFHKDVPYIGNNRLNEDWSVVPSLTLRIWKIVSAAVLFHSPISLAGYHKIWITLCHGSHDDTSYVVETVRSKIKWTVRTNYTYGDLAASTTLQMNKVLERTIRNQLKKMKLKCPVFAFQNNTGTGQMFHNIWTL